MLRLVAIPYLLKRADGYVALVVQSDGTTTVARWVGPFQDGAAVVEWLEVLHDEVEALTTPTALGLPVELAVLRPLEDQVRACRDASLGGGSR